MSSQSSPGGITWLGNRAGARTMLLIFTTTSVLLALAGLYFLSTGSRRGGTYRGAGILAAAVLDLVIGVLLARVNTGVTGEHLILRPPFSLTAKRIGWNTVTGFAVSRRQAKNAATTYYLTIHVTSQTEPIVAPGCSSADESVVAKLAADLEARRQQHG